MTGPYEGKTSSGFLMLDRSRVLSGAIYTDLVHEFFHVLQFAHNYAVTFQRAANGRRGVEYWWTEASATWAESYFARSTAPTEVYFRFSAVFQDSKKSLHRSYSSNEQRYEMYAAFIWGLFAEQDKTANIIKTSWDALRNASNHEDATLRLDAVFDFKSNFRNFALRNLNTDLPGVLPLSKRYNRDTSRRFPDNIEPGYADKLVLTQTLNFRTPVEIAPLRAQYYRYPIGGTPHPQIRQITFYFDEINSKEDLDLDAVVRIAGEDWKLEDYTGRAKKTFCLDKAAENLAEIIFIFSNHSLPLTQFVFGNLRVEASEVGCANTWKGTLEHRTTTVVPGASTNDVLTADVTLEQDDAAGFGASLIAFRPTGSWTFGRSGTIASCTVSVEPVHGTLNKASVQGVMFLHADESPVSYEGAIETGPFDATWRMVCPDPGANQSMTLSFDEPLFLVHKEQNFTISPDGNSIKGSYTEPSNNPGAMVSSSYAWDLTLQK